LSVCLELPKSTDAGSAWRRCFGITGVLVALLFSAGCHTVTHRLVSPSATRVPASELPRARLRFEGYTMAYSPSQQVALPPRLMYMEHRFRYPSLFVQDGPALRVLVSRSKENIRITPSSWYIPYLWTVWYAIGPEVDSKGNVETSAYTILPADDSAEPIRLTFEKKVKSTEVRWPRFFPSEPKRREVPPIVSPARVHFFADHLVSKLSEPGLKESIEDAYARAEARWFASQQSDTDAGWRPVARPELFEKHWKEITSRPLPVPPKSGPSVPGPDTGQRWAVLVGVSDYKHAGECGLKNLRFAHRDAKEVWQQLRNSKAPRWPEANMRLLTNEQATKRGVEEALLTFLKKAQEEDVVLIFLSGHGALDPARPWNYYFLCHDTDPRKLESTAFPMWRIEEALKRKIIRARRVVVLADACHAGGFRPEGLKDLEVVSRNVNDSLGLLAQGGHRLVLTSCGSRELSREDASWGGGHGAFACALVRGLSGVADATAAKNKNAAGNGDGKVGLAELVSYVKREVGDLTSGGQHVQAFGRLNVVLVGM